MTAHVTPAFVAATRSNSATEETELPAPRPAYSQMKQPRTNRKTLWYLVIVTLVARPYAASVLAAPSTNAPSQMTFLDNGELRVGMDLSLGGAVTFIASRDHPGNIINSADLGRQIQMSHYSGPWPFEVGDKKPNKAWAGLGWNPIQTGDCYGNPSKVVERRNDGREIYIKCAPMQWPLNNVPGDCVFETWTSLDGPVIHMRFRCTNQRADKAAYRPCPQELPAVYTISRLDRLMSYTGDQPFTGAALTRVTNDWRQPWPWTRFVATEGWAALVDEHGWGLGVFKEDGAEFHGGVYGDARSDDPKHSSTSYLAPIHRETFDYNIVYEHRTEFVVGQITEIRKRFNDMATRTPRAWRFARDRQHWTLQNATDQGLPLDGEWRISWGSGTPRLESPTRCWRVETAPLLELRMGCMAPSPSARVFWKRLDDDQFDEKKSLTVKLIPDGVLRRYYADLASSPEYRGLITGLAIEFLGQPRPGDSLGIRSIMLSADRGEAVR